MQRVIILLVWIVVFASFAGCDKKAEPPAAPTPEAADRMPHTADVQSIDEGNRGGAKAAKSIDEGNRGGAKAK